MPHDQRLKYKPMAEHPIDSLIQPSSSSEPSLQERFEAMRKRRQAAAGRVRAAEAAKAKGSRTAAAKDALRAKFVKQVSSYVGTPYSAARNETSTGDESLPIIPTSADDGHKALYLDCCGLVRRALTDLKEDFGFEVGPWNQSYLFDTLPQDIAECDLKPGDLIFWQAEYDDASKKPSRHNLVHVEIFTGKGTTGQGTIGSRYEGPQVDWPGVYAFDSYITFSGHNAHSHVRLYRSIESWLEGICISHCPTCTWGEPTTKCAGGRGASSMLFAAECTQGDC